MTSRLLCLCEEGLYKDIGLAGLISMNSSWDELLIRASLSEPHSNVENVIVVHT